MPGQSGSARMTVAAFLEWARRRPAGVVEVLSASTRDRDFTVKLAGYAALPSVAHYLLVETDRRLVSPASRSCAPRSCGKASCASTRPD